MTTGLSFRLFHIPFRVQLWFLVTLVLLSLGELSRFPDYALLATVLFFTKVAVGALVFIVHELGHCFAYRRYGQEPWVLLWGLGGLTFGQEHLPPKKSLVVSAAGSLSALVLLALPCYVLRQQVLSFPLYDMRHLPSLVVDQIFWFALYWSIFNLLPILPLDGGHIVEAILEWVKGSPQKQTSRLVSGVAGAFFGFVALAVFGEPGMMLVLWLLAAASLVPYWQERNNQPVMQFLPDEDMPMGGMGGMSDGGRGASVVSMDKARKKRDRRSPAELVKAGYDALERREYKVALRIAERLQEKRLNAELDRWTAELAAFVWLGDRNPIKAVEVLGGLPKSANVSKPLVAIVAIANKRIDEGVKVMVESMVHEPEGGPKLIAVDLFAEYGMIHRLARDLVDLQGGSGFEAAVALEGMLHRLHRTQDASTVSDVILLG